MLVFRRKVGEAVMLEDQIEVQVLEITGSRVKLGFSAPPEVLIVRKELYLTQEENRRAVACSASGSLTRLANALRPTTSPDPQGLAGPLE
jgi:carbon storage regulator